MIFLLAPSATCVGQVFNNWSVKLFIWGKLHKLRTRVIYTHYLSNSSSVDNNLVSFNPTCYPLAFTWESWLLTLLFVHVMINPQNLCNIFNSEYDTMWCAKNFSVMFPETFFYIHILKFCWGFRVGYCQMTFHCSVE